MRAAWKLHYIHAHHTIRHNDGGECIEGLYKIYHDLGEEMTLRRLAPKLRHHDEQYERKLQIYQDTDHTDHQFFVKYHPRLRHTYRAYLPRHPIQYHPIWRRQTNGVRDFLLRHLVWSIFQFVRQSVFCVFLARNLQQSQRKTVISP